MSGTVTKDPIKICITGAAGRIAYSLIQSLSKGDVFGHDQMMILHLLDIEKSKDALHGIALEIEDLASHVVLDCVITTSPLEAFADADIAILIASMPHLPGMERIDLLRANTKIFRETGEALERVAKRSIKVLVVANPSNTNALITMKYAPSISPSQFTGLSMLDHNRTVAQIARKLGPNSNTDHIKNVVVWGNHSSTMYPDLSHATLLDPHTNTVSPIKDIVDPTWARGELLQIVRTRFSEIINRRGMTTMSTGKAIADHLRSWSNGTLCGTHVSMALPSNGEYGVPQGVFFSFPVTVDYAGNVSVRTGLELDEFTKDMIAESYKELKTEADQALQLAAEEQ